VHKSYEKEMMLRLSVFILLVLVGQKAFSEPMIEKAWYCSSKYEVGDLQNIIEDKINFEDGGSYSLSTNITFVAIGGRKSELIAFLDGDYSYGDGLLEYKQVRNINIKIESDDLGMLTSVSIENLKDMLSQNSEAKYKTLKLSNEIWVSQNSVSDEKITCRTTK
jgi:hypothetical protein